MTNSRNFHHPEETSDLLAVSSNSLLSPSSDTTDLLSVPIVCLFWTLHINGIIQYVAICVSPPGPLLVSERTQEPDVTNSWGILALSPPDWRQVSAWQSISTEGQKHKSISSSMK